MLISHLLPVAAGGQQVAVGSPAVAPVLEEVGKRGSLNLNGKGGQKEAKPRLCNLPNDKQPSDEGPGVTELRSQQHRWRLQHTIIIT